MLAPVLTSADFLRAFQALMPRGRVWNTDPDSIQTKAASGLTPSYAAQTARSNNLLVDAFPATTYELLPEWEATLGLPDPCAGTSPSTQARRNQVVARLANSGASLPPISRGWRAILATRSTSLITPHSAAAKARRGNLLAARTGRTHGPSTRRLIPSCASQPGGLPQATPWEVGATPFWSAKYAPLLLRMR